MTIAIDHIVVGAKDLASGLENLEESLGVRVPLGGKHPAMSTHNAVMRIGEAMFFELIAIDPQAPAPGRIRWFSLDEADTRARLSKRPRALCWVAQTDDLQGLIARSPFDPGRPLALSRGDLRWQLTVPDDGHLPEKGLLPGLLEWGQDIHPSVNQQDLGVRLKAIHLTHPEPDHLKMLLKDFQAEPMIDVHKGSHALSFELATPRGDVVLD